MPNKPFIHKIRAMSDSELDKELMSHANNDMGRNMILNELSRRSSRRYALLSVVISLIALSIAVISNWPDLENCFG